jgi:hypothetical protein
MKIPGRRPCSEYKDEDKALDDYRKSLFLKVPSFALWMSLSAKITQFLDWSWKNFLRDFVAVV